MYRFLAASLVAVTLAVASLATTSASATERHCATFLIQPVGSSGSGPATEVDLGCYPTFAEAVAAGSGGAMSWRIAATSSAART